MGLIKAAKDALSGLLADQWREYFYCDALSDDVLMVKGQKRNTNNNNKGMDNIISNGSIIAVNEGQCMIIVDQGGIAEFCADAGEFVYDTSSEPSIFAGDLGQSVVNSFKTMARRFTGGGETLKDQRVYFFNTKEIRGNLYGTATAIPFRVYDKKLNFDMDTILRCNGEYSFRLIDPLLFYKNVAGNTKDEFRKSELSGIMKAELISALQPALAKISEMGVRPNEIPAHINELTEFMNQELSEKWTQMRGITVFSMTMNPPSIPEEDRKTLNELQKTKALTDPSMAAATLASAQAEAMKLAAANESAGPMMAFAGMNMANMTGGINAGGLFQMAQANQQAAGQPQNPGSASNVQMQAPVAGWTCSCGKADNRGKFCENCGKPKPAEAGWTCSCGTVNQGKFCQNCGQKRPEGAPLYKCDKCGWEPEDPAHPPKFCPECGDVFDDSDRV